MKAVVTKGNNKIAVEDKPKPTPGPNQVLIKIAAAALNPTDWKHVSGAAPGNIVGCDFAGYVEEIGAEVPANKVEVGQLRNGFVRGSVSPDVGSFAEYIAIDWDLTGSIPKSISPEKASTVALSLGTAAQGIYHILKVPQPPVPYPDTIPTGGKWFLVWSGATGAGQMAIQVAKLSGLRVVTTSSPANFDKLKSLGAELVFDYNDPEAPEKIRKATNDEITLGFDGFSTPQTLAQAQRAFGPSGGHLGAILFDLSNLPRPEVKTEHLLVYTALGADAPVGPQLVVKTSPEIRGLYANWQTERVYELLDRGLLKPFDEIVVGGLEDVAKGFELVRDPSSNGKKVVIHVP